MNKKPKLIAVVGPTASGKSDLAVGLALAFSGEVISADSRQVYKGLDIGSGKITKKEMRGIPHYLLDVAEPQNTFSVADYKVLAEEKIAEILKKNKLPIIAGGTGFYIDSVVYDINLPAVPPNEILRQELSQESLPALQVKLKNLDPDRFKEIDQENKVRLIRAIEIAQSLGQVPKATKEESPYDFLILGLSATQDELDIKIKKRLIDRLENGLIAEVKKLQEEKVTWERLESFGLEYRFVAYYLQDKISYDELVEKLFIAIRQYSRRQMTWFKRDKSIKWIKGEDEALLLINQWLNKK